MRLIRYEQPEWNARWPENWLNRWLGESLGRQLFPGMFGSEEEMNWSGEGTRGGSLRANLYEDADHYHARFELPGVKKEDLKLELHNAVLTVSYTHRRESDEDGENGSKATAVQSFSRTISLPEGVKGDGVMARMEDGVLTVTLPKEEAHKPRAIAIG